MLDQSHLQHQITEEQLHDFNQLGYLIVEEVLPEELVNQLENRIDQIYQQHLEHRNQVNTKTKSVRLA